jgi:excinuclease UvrABC helicase subunit UvrB
VRPTGLVDPPVEVRRRAGQVDDVLGRDPLTRGANERVLSRR